MQWRGRRRTRVRCDEPALVRRARRLAPRPASARAARTRRATRRQQTRCAIRIRIASCFVRALEQCGHLYLLHSALTQLSRLHFTPLRCAQIWTTAERSPSRRPHASRVSIVCPIVSSRLVSCYRTSRHSFQALIGTPSDARCCYPIAFTHSLTQSGEPHGCTVRECVSVVRCAQSSSSRRRRRSPAKT